MGAQWAIWRAGGLAVPLSTAQAPAEWDYILEDTGATVVVAGDDVAGDVEAVARARSARVVPASSLWERRAATRRCRRSPITVAR